MTKKIPVIRLMMNQMIVNQMIVNQMIVSKIYSVIDNG